MTNDVELNAILYYADFLSLQATNQPVTDMCKYFFTYGTPINAAYVVGNQPIYDEKNLYFQKANKQYNMIKDSLGEEAVASFIEDIAMLRSCGMVDANRMLQAIHQYSSKKDRRKAFEAYQKWEAEQKYTHIVTDELGNKVEKPCTKYVYHSERNNKQPRLAKSFIESDQVRERVELDIP